MITVLGKKCLIVTFAPQMQNAWLMEVVPLPCGAEIGNLCDSLEDIFKSMFRVLHRHAGIHFKGPSPFFWDRVPSGWTWIQRPVCLSCAEINRHMLQAFSYSHFCMCLLGV